MTGHFSLPTALPIRSIHQDNYRTRTLVLDGAVAAMPGQFAMAWLPRFDEKPFSLVNADPVTVMITAVGPFTRLVHELRVGDKLWVRGPFGHGFRLPATPGHIALAGGGYGVAPLFWLAQQAVAAGHQVTAVIGARTAADLLYLDRFATLPVERCTVVATTEDGTAGVPGRVTAPLEPLLQRRAVAGLYACGPHGMLHALDGLCRRTGVPGQLSWEAYMRCAIGICGACEHGGAVLCMDGPVLATAPAQPVAA